MKTISRISALCGGLALAVASQMALAQSNAAGSVAASPASASRVKVELCIGCHGVPNYKSAYPEVYRVPMIGGQNAKYIESALKAYRSGERKHPSMRAIAGSLTDQDISALAAYYSSQK